MLIRRMKCASRSKQQLQKTKAESASPTAHTDFVFLVLMIDALKKYATGIVGTKGLGLSNKMDEFIVLKLTDEQVDFTQRTKLVMNT